MAVVISLSGAVGNKRDVCAIRRPLWIRIVPILPLRDLLCLSSRHARDPQVSAPVVKPPRVIEFVLDMRVMPHIALAIRSCDIIHWSRSADNNNPRSLWRPLVTLHTVLQSCKRNRLAPAGHGQQKNLRFRSFAGRKIRSSRRKKCQRLPIRTPSRRVGAKPFGAKSPRRRRTVGRHYPNGRLPPVFLLVDHRQNKSDHSAIRRNMRIANKFERKIVFWSDSPLGLRARRVRAKIKQTTNNEQRPKFSHGDANSSTRTKGHKRFRP